jgi:two-component system, OmpR family, KDP operon response regulator KdpE
MFSLCHLCDLPVSSTMAKGFMSNSERRILIVDDDPHFRRTLQLALHSYGYKAGDAANGEEALEAVRTTVPDLIVLDWQLPGMNGIQTCRALRARYSVPVIIVSGNRSNSKIAALDAGANDFLAKPFAINELVTRIESALQH